jgi:signal transduction histidine kinase
MTAPLLQAAVHDLKNALGSLENELERLVMQQQLAAVAPAHALCSRLRVRLLGFLLLSTEGGERVADAQAQHPPDFLSETAAGFVLPMRGLALTLEVADDSPDLAFFDARLVNLALHALLANAAQFARSRIVLGAARSGSGLVLSCDDDGLGWGVAGPTPGGSGLGTEICRRVAQAHRSGNVQGRLVLAASALGGARAELHLP